MLKIKNNVDLKELEKFGFHKIYPYQHNDYWCYRFILDGVSCIEIDTRKEISIEIDETTTLYLDILYDLIQADFVEKV